MTRHYPRPRHHQQQQQEGQQQSQQQRDKGWYCKEHDIKYLCDICGYDNAHEQKQMKYYFVSG